MQKGITLSVIFTLIASLILPSLSAHASTDLENEVLDNNDIVVTQGIEIIEETDNKIVYRTSEENENGEMVTYEYNEVTKSNKNKDTIKTKVYEVNIETNKKKLVNNFTTNVVEEEDGTVTIEELGDTDSIVSIDSDAVNAEVISEEDGMISASSWSGWTQSSIHDIGYKQNFSTKRGIAKWAHYGSNKNRPLSNSSFDKFTREVDSLKGSEKAIITGNVIGLAVEIGNIVFKGQTVTMAVIKSVAKKALRSLVAVTVLWDVYQWSMQLERATKHFKAM